MNAPFLAVDRARDVRRDFGRLPKGADVEAYRVVILALPGFSQLTLSSFVDPLRLANSVSSRASFEWAIASLDGNPVECASGLWLSASTDFARTGQSLQTGKRPNMVIVCAGDRVEKQSSASLLRILRLCGRHGVPIAALGTATWLLAESGLLDDTACTIHWDKRAALSETFRRLQVTDRLFVRNARVATCAGEFASFDFVMELIGEHLGEEAALAVCRHTIASHWRSASDRQWTSSTDATGIGKALAEVICIMEEYVENPLPLRDIARRVGRSQRQIERLFKHSVSSSPMRYYLHMRLARAKRLVEQTELPMVEIAIACGFVSASHFSKCFRTVFDINPSACRN